MVTVIIPTPERDQDVTAACVRSLINNYTEIRLAPWAGSFARTVNLASLEVSTEFIACVNNDTVAPPQWLQLLHHNDDNIGIVCPAETSQPGFDPSAELVWGARGFFGGFWAMPTRLWESLKGFDERFHPYYCEDTDLLWRVEKAGKKILQDHRVKVAHLQNNTIKHDPNRDDILLQNVHRFEEKNGFDPISYQH